MRAAIARVRTASAQRRARPHKDSPFAKLKELRLLR